MNNKPMRKLVFERDKGVCAKCGIDTLRTDFKMPSVYKSNCAWIADHIISRAMGGKHILENMQTLCYKCNLEKDKEDRIKFESSERRYKQIMRMG